MEERCLAAGTDFVVVVVAADSAVAAEIVGQVVG